MGRPRKEDEAPPADAPRHSRGYKADPSAVLHPQAQVTVDRLTAGRSFGIGGAEQRPPVLRAGALDASRIPSRMGNRLVLPMGAPAPRPWATPMPAPAAAATPAPAIPQPACNTAAAPAAPAPQRARRRPGAAPATALPWQKQPGWPFTSA